jgi:hypothetical protein
MKQYIDFYKRTNKKTSKLLKINDVTVKIRKKIVYSKNVENFQGNRFK